MKPLPSIVGFGILLLAVGCRRDPGPDIPVPRLDAAEVKATSTDALSPALQKALLEKGQRIAAEAFGLLSSRLGKAIADAGFTNAIEVCALHGLTLTTSVGVSNQVVVRRVTDRPRNPENRADPGELAIIRQFEADLTKGVTLQPVVTATKADYFTYYAPIVLKLPLCLSCHGEPGADIKPDVLAEIKAKYPTDEAVGFRQGQLRGLWSVDFKRSDFVASP